jgi:hypothetical protein
MSNTHDPETAVESSSSNSSAETATEASALDRAELAAQRDLLVAENRRLRDLVATKRRRRYRGTALGLCAVGVLCGLLTVVVPSASTVLFSLAGTGVFGGVLTYVLTPERFIAADISERVYESTAESYERLCGDLGLSDRRVYVPPASTGEDEETVGGWLFVPQQSDTEVPDPEAFDSALIVEEGHRGLSVRPTGSGLLTALQASLTDPLGATPDTVCRQLSDALVEEFELADTVEYDTDPVDGRLSIRLTEPLYGDGSRFDHPVVSMLAVGVAMGLDTPVETTVTATEPLSVTLRWEPDAVDADAENE